MLIGSETSGGGTSGNNSENLVLHGDALLVAAGRKPNVAALNLEAAGVAYDARGIKVDDRCRTSRSGIYAVGDVTGRFAFTHMSEHMAKVAVMNALLKMPVKIDGAHLPWTTYADPELAHVGATEDALRAAGKKYETLRFPYDKIDRAITEREEYGMIKVHARPRDGENTGGVHPGRPGRRSDLRVSSCYAAGHLLAAYLGYHPPLPFLWIRRAAGGGPMVHQAVLAGAHPRVEAPVRLSGPSAGVRARRDRLGERALPIFPAFQPATTRCAGSFVPLDIVIIPGTARRSKRSGSSDVVQRRRQRRGFDKVIPVRCG